MSIKGFHLIFIAIAALFWSIKDVSAMLALKFEA